MYKIKDFDTQENTAIPQLYNDICDLLLMADEDGIAWLSTQEIIDYIGTSYGNHVVVILHVMHCANELRAARAIDTDSGKNCLVWSSGEIPF